MKVTLHLNYDGAEDITRTGVVGSNYNYILDAETISWTPMAG